MKISAEKVRHVAVVVFIGIVFYVGFIIGETLSQSASPNIYLDDLPSAISYKIDTDGTYYWATKYDGSVVYGSSTNEGGVSGTNATNVIQATQDILSSGGTIFINEGTYWVSKITLTNPVIVEGTLGTILKAQANLASPNLDVLCVSGGATKGVVIRDLVVDGNKANQANAVDGIEVSGSERVILENVIVQNSKAYGIRLSSNSIAVNCKVTGGDMWGYTVSGDNCLLMNCISESNGEGFYIAGEGSRLIGCTAKSNDRGFQITYTGIRNRLEGCYAFNNQYAGFDIRAVQNTFIDCVAKDNSQAQDGYASGFYLYTYSGVNATHNFFVGCKALSTGAKRHDYGFNEADANQDYNQFLGCHAFGNKDGQIRIQGANSNSTLCIEG